GAVVSEAAQDHSNDEECGDHGAYVSSVAQGLDDCEPVDEAVEGEEEAAEEEEEGTEEEGDEGPPEDSHGAVVSEAAQDHSNDEECGNHGAYVSSVARGLEDCEVPPGLEEPVDGEDDEGEGDDEDGEVEAESVEPAGPPDHAPGPPADAGPPAGAGPNR
ncbi:MAG: hypothetical protein ACLFRV_14970, partial [Acidimicrobiales bacterium]